MKIQDILTNGKSDNVIAELKSRRFIPQPDVETANKAVDIDEHDIMDGTIRKDKWVVDDSDDETANESAQKVIDVNPNDSNEHKGMHIEKVNRITLALQKLIIARAVSFCFGTPVDYNASPDNDKQTMILNALKRILKDVKATSLDRKIARQIFTYTECAELWYPVAKPNEHYGFKSNFKLRVAIFSPGLGDTLYPYFDDTGDMIAFSRSFSRKDEKGVAREYFETYTDEEHALWTIGKEGEQLVEGYPTPIAIGKIPVIYGNQDHCETADINSLVDRLELLLSNFADTNDYHASPKIFTTGQINGWSKKGEAGAVIEGEDGATMQYVSWQQAPEAVKLEIQTLLQMIYTITQTPDISFESVKGIGAISGLALKLLFMDAHLKVQDKREIFDDYLQRRVNVIKAFIGTFNTQLETEADKMDIEPEITPYMLTNKIDDLNYWLAANGNKPVVSQSDSVRECGISKNPDKTIEDLANEASIANSFTIGEPQNEGDA